jgi:hypothetical protein
MMQHVSPTRDVSLTLMCVILHCHGDWFPGCQVVTSYHVCHDCQLLWLLGCDITPLLTQLQSCDFTPQLVYLTLSMISGL